MKWLFALGVLPGCGAVAFHEKTAQLDALGGADGGAKTLLDAKKTLHTTFAQLMVGLGI